MPLSLLAVLFTLMACGASADGSSAAPERVASVGIAPSAVTVIAGQSKQLSAQLLSATGAALPDRPVAWASSDATVAAVSSAGVLDGLKPGSAVITATSEGKSGTAAVSIVPVPVSSVTATPATRTLIAGQTLYLSAVVRDSVGNALADRVVTWSSSDTLKVVVTSAGLASSRAPGTVTITASSEGKAGTVGLNVTPTTYATQATCQATTVYDAINHDFVIGEYRVRNDKWGVAAGYVKPASAFTQCLRTTQIGEGSFMASWDWSFASDAIITGLSGYPGMIYGWNPGEPASTTPAMPVQVSAIGALAVTYDMTMVSTGYVQTFFDLYFTSTRTPSLASMTHEVSISIRAPQWTGAHTLVGTTTIDGHLFELWHGPTSLPQADGFSWIAKPDMLSGTLNIRKFTDYMVEHGFIKPNEFLTSLEFGTEPSGGVGSVSMNYYRITR